MNISDWSISKSKNGYDYVLQGRISRVFKINARIKSIDMIRVGLIVYVYGIRVMCLYGSENERAFEETKKCIDMLTGGKE